MIDVTKQKEYTLDLENLDFVFTNIGNVGDMVLFEYGNSKIYRTVREDNTVYYVLPEEEITNRKTLHIYNLTSDTNYEIVMIADIPMMATYALENEPMDIAEVIKYYTINVETREITVPPDKTFLGVFSDRNVMRKHFKCPKTIGENIDLSTCDIFINYVSVGNALGQYRCNDVKVSGSDITFSWLLSGNLFDTNKNGNVYFAMQAKTKTGQNVFNTTKAMGIVKETVEAVDYTEERYVDVILDMLNRIEVLESNSGSGTGTNNYVDLINKPKINSIELSGNITSKQLGIPTVQDVLNALPKWNGGSY